MFRAVASFCFELVCRRVEKDLVGGGDFVGVFHVSSPVCMAQVYQTNSGKQQEKQYPTTSKGFYLGLFSFSLFLC